VTTATLTTPSRPARREGLSLPRVIHSEWIKFRSLRSTWISIGAALLAAIGLGILLSALRASHFGRPIFKGPGGVHQVQGIPPGYDSAFTSLHGLLLAQLAIGVLGVLMITGEYATGMIRATLTSVPVRTPVLLAKAIVFGAAIFAIAFPASLIAFLGGQAAMHSNHLGVSLSSPGAFRAVVGGGLFLMLIGLLGLGCGFAIRNTGGAIATLFGLVLVAPLITAAFPTSWQNHIDKYLPVNAGVSLMTTSPQSNSFGALAGGLVLAAWVVAALGIGLTVLRRRDA
jgi:hypothetical protein